MAGTILNRFFGIGSLSFQCEASTECYDSDKPLSHTNGSTLYLCVESVSRQIHQVRRLGWDMEASNA